MRSKYAFMNTIIGILYQLVNGVINVVLRRIIISSIGIDYLGVNGLFSNIFQLLCLVESGFGVAIVYMLYKPIQENDELQIAKFLNYFKKIYKVIALLVLVIGILFTPLLKYIIQDNPFSYKMTVVYYLLFLLNTVSSYFLAYKQSFLNACQRQYYVNIISIISVIFFAVLKIISLIVLKNYIVYLVIIIANTCFINLLVSIIVDKKYQYLKKFKKKKLQAEYVSKIKDDVKALFFHKIGGYILNGTDNLVITYFIGLSVVGIYSNYVLIISMLNIFINQIFTAIIPAFGGIIAEDAKKKTNRIYNIFHLSYFVSFLLYGACSLILCAVVQPFMCLWTGGTQYTLKMVIVYLIIFNFYLGGMRSAPNAVKSAAGIYRQDRFSPICEATINLVVSVVLASKIGIAGVIIGTITSNLAMPFWTAPYFVYRDLFKKNFSDFLIRTLKYFILLIIGVFIINELQKLIIFDGTILSFVILCLCSAIFVFFYMGLIFYFSKEKKNLISYIFTIVNRKG